MERTDATPTRLARAIRPDTAVPRFDTCASDISRDPETSDASQVYSGVVTGAPPPPRAGRTGIFDCRKPDDLR